MFDFDNMSRDELLMAVKQQAEALLSYGNHPPIAVCPFCMGSGVCSALKMNVKETLIEEWNRNVTREEYDDFAKRMHEAFKPQATQAIGAAHA